MNMLRVGDDDFDESAAAHASAVRILDEGRRFQLLPRDLAILILLKTRLAKRNGAATVLTESEIRGVFRSIDDLEANTTTVGFEVRFGGACGRLLESGCLVRSDAHRMASDDPEFVLTGIGEAIAEWNTTASDMSAESLMSIMEAFNAQLSALVERSQKTTFDDDWRWIERQLRWVLTSMLRNVAGHQAMLDSTFTRITEIVPTLLEKKNDESIGDCEEILDRVVKTINDLYQVILQAANTAYALLERMEENARSSPECPASIMSHFTHIAGQISSITEWTRLRQKSWVAHHAFIHHFIRNVIRVDRDRRVSEALKRELAREPRWTLSVADMPKAFDIKDNLLPSPTRHAPRRERQSMIIEVVQENKDDLRTRLEEALTSSLANGEARLSSLLKGEATLDTPLVDIARAAPWIMGRMVESARPDLAIKEWAQVKGSAEVQELIVKKKP